MHCSRFRIAASLRPNSPTRRSSRCAWSPLTRRRPQDGIRGYRVPGLRSSRARWRCLRLRSIAGRRVPSTPAPGATLDITGHRAPLSKVRTSSAGEQEKQPTDSGRRPGIVPAGRNPWAVGPSPGIGCSLPPWGRLTLAVPCRRHESAHCFTGHREMHASRRTRGSRRGSGRRCGKGTRRRNAGNGRCSRSRCRG